MKIIKFLFVFIFIIVNFILAQTYTQKDVEICNSKFELAVDKNLSTKPINEIIIEIGKSFLGTDYVAYTLEKGEKENLVINLAGLDCYTFLESTFALSRCVKNGKRTFEDYLKEIENLRYRDGKLKEYPSRLHYFSDWIYDIDKRGLGKNITKEIGGEKLNKKINFMTTHIESYRQLKENSNYVDEMKKIEKEISQRDNYFISEEKIAEVENKIQSGDIIGITSTLEGMDIAHTGIAIKLEDGRIHFMHAPNVGKKVEITTKPLADYVLGNKKQNGIMVLRPL